LTGGFVQGIDHKRVPLWGGRTSLWEILDAYRGVLDSLEEVDLAGIDELDVAWAAPSRGAAQTSWRMKARRSLKVDS